MKCARAAGESAVETVSCQDPGNICTVQNHSEERVGQYLLHLGKAFSVDMIHHDNFIVKGSTGPSRAEARERKRITLN